MRKSQVARAISLLSFLAFLHFFPPGRVEAGLLLLVGVSSYVQGLFEGEETYGG